MENYAATYPSENVMAVERLERLKGFISEFYAISDDAARNEEWVDCFLPDALLVVGDKSIRGVDEIRKSRDGMWQNVRSRSHKLGKVYPAAFEPSGHEPEGRIEYMLNGSVEFDKKSGEKVIAQWAARAVLVDVGGRFRYSLYQVWLHTASG